MPCPWPWLLVQLAERFHVLPWQLKDEPTDEVLFHLHLLGIEGEYRSDTQGLEPDEDFYDMDDAP